MIARVASSISDTLCRFKNRLRPRLLIYTDSRGFFVAGKWGKHPFGTYVGLLRARYHVTQHVCPEKYTTIIDFLDHISNNDISKYDAIIMHCGIVDFSPRPLSSISALRDSKAGRSDFAQLFTANSNYYAKPFETKYSGEPTINIYSPTYLTDEVIPALARLPNLIWINSNRFVSGWNGNYSKGRPLNIDEVVSHFDGLMRNHVPHTVDLTHWTDREIREYTIDNIHFTRTGFAQIFQLINRELMTIIPTQ
jgi:hypothetical protein